MLPLPPVPSGQEVLQSLLDQCLLGLCGLFMTTSTHHLSWALLASSRILWSFSKWACLFLWLYLALTWWLSLPPSTDWEPNILQTKSTVIGTICDGPSQRCERLALLLSCNTALTGAGRSLEHGDISDGQIYVIIREAVPAKTGSIIQFTQAKTNVKFHFPTAQRLPPGNQSECSFWVP